jgi:hypothetical protein
MFGSARVPGAAETVGEDVGSRNDCRVQWEGWNDQGGKFELDERIDDLCSMSKEIKENISRCRKG